MILRPLPTINRPIGLFRACACTIGRDAAHSQDQSDGRYAACQPHYALASASARLFNAFM